MTVEFYSRLRLAEEYSNVSAWGWNDDGQLGTGGYHDKIDPVRLYAQDFEGKEVAQVACGKLTSAAVTGALAMWCRSLILHSRWLPVCMGRKCKRPARLGSSSTAVQSGASI